jgi:hypothetical protein
MRPASNALPAREVRRAPLQAELPLTAAAAGAGASRPAADEAAPAGTAAVHWRALLAGNSPREVLSRIVQGDPLGVRERVAQRLREDAYLLDADRVHLRCLARCARMAPRYRGSPELPVWIDALVVESVAELLREDAETRRREPSQPARGACAFDALARPLGLDPAAMRQACVGVNRMPREDRKAFYELVIRGRSLDALAQQSGPTPTPIARRAPAVLENVLRAAHAPDQGRNEAEP